MVVLQAAVEKGWSSLPSDRHDAHALLEALQEELRLVTCLSHTVDLPSSCRSEAI